MSLSLKRAPLGRLNPNDISHDVAGRIIWDLSVHLFFLGAIVGILLY